LLIKLLLLLILLIFRETIGALCTGGNLISWHLKELSIFFLFKFSSFSKKIFSALSYSRTLLFAMKNITIMKKNRNKLSTEKERKREWEEIFFCYSFLFHFFFCWMFFFLSVDVFFT
jgi:hypothetical protein